MKKICSTCKIEQDIENFSKNKTKKDGYSYQCKGCRSVYRQINKEKIKEYGKKYVENNKEITKRINRKYFAKRIKADNLFKLKNAIRANINYNIKNLNIDKTSKTESILGCSFKEFKSYIESKFESWMNWDNYGLYNGELNYGWDFDHIIPVSTASSKNEIILLNHYTNFQPLCSKTNRDIKKNLK